MNSREKGKAGELELARIIRKHGYIARRGQQFCGVNGDADIIGIPGVHIECKRVEKLNIHDAMQQAVRDAREGEIPVVMHRKNRTEWMATMRLEDWLQEGGSWMSCAEYIPAGHENAVSRQYLRDMTGNTDRSNRREIKESDELVLNLQDGKGYFKPAPGEERLVRAFIRQEESRIREIQKTVKKAKFYLRDKHKRQEDIGQMSIFDLGV